MLEVIQLAMLEERADYTLVQRCPADVLLDPLVLKRFSCCQTHFQIGFEELADKVFGLWRDRVPRLIIKLIVARLNLLEQLRLVVRPKRWVACKHVISHDTYGPII